MVLMCLHVLDPVDYIVRAARRLEHLPPYSIRVRSNGIRKQFGGKNFAYYGQILSEALMKYASLSSTSKVLEIGCGCGRTALALTEYLDNGNYIGVDIEKQSLESCKNNPLLAAKKFKFELLDIQNSIYNPEGKYKADNFVFPYLDATFDIVFLVSVFTHMLTPQVKNYIKEISRILKSKGICMFTTFLMDYGREGKDVIFENKHMEHYYCNSSIEELAVGYYLDFYIKTFARHKMALHVEPLLGNWRKNYKRKATTNFSQDIVFFYKNDKE